MAKGKRRPRGDNGRFLPKKPKSGFDDGLGLRLEPVSREAAVLTIAPSVKLCARPTRGRVGHAFLRGITYSQPIPCNREKGHAGACRAGSPEDFERGR